ncbi:uncharacterized protein LOC131185903 isoform X2 [Ahaetulla prasina]|uniref:uncharacterized protein LOC131185903 isoform X2 n=1 Tax=Ahaetulla prasina TaxID=499056 RepID=UPI002649049B|nr:uncharacterized protein LOC131185903 isoform X2 [Ahaetulla prasina]
MEAAERPRLPESSSGTQSKQPPHLRKTSKMSHHAWTSMAEQEAGASPSVKGRTGPIQVSTREIQLSRSLEERGTGVQMSGKGPEGPVFPKQCSEEGRKGNALWYRLEEAELSIVTSQGEIHPSDSPADSERKREMTDRTWPWVQIYNFGRQQSWEREAAGGSREMTEAPRGALRWQISRSDSESSSGAESRQVNRLTLNSPGEESKAEILNWLDFSAGKENGETESQEAEEQTSGNPAMVTGEMVAGLPWPARAPNGCHVGGERKPEESESIKVDKGLEIKRPTVLSLDLVSPQTRKPSKQTCSPSLAVKEDEGLCGQLGFDSRSPVEDLQSPETETRPMETSSESSPSTVVMLLCSSHASSQASGETAQGDEPLLPPQQRKRTTQQEEEKALKVADVKKTFEKRKPAAKKVASPARKASLSGQKRTP